jgi:DNA-binding transcriptional regulator YiaG
VDLERATDRVFELQATKEAAAYAASLLIGGEARRLRLAAGATLAEVALELGCSPGSVCNWEALKRKPSGPNAVRYAELLREWEGAES